MDNPTEGFTRWQRVMEHLRGERLARYIKRTLFEPLEITTASYVWEDGFEPLAAGSRPDQDEMPAHANATRNAAPASSS